MAKPFVQYIKLGPINQYNIEAQAGPSERPREFNDLPMPIIVPFSSSRPNLDVIVFIRVSVVDDEKQ